MLTTYGKVLRKLRIDRQELLKDMADKLDVSSAYLSAVEMGKRRIPPGWTSRIKVLYQLDAKAEKELVEAEDEALSEIKISLHNASLVKRNAVLTFAKALDGLSDDELKQIMMSMNKKERNDRGRA